MIGRRQFGVGLTAAGLTALQATLLRRSALGADDVKHTEHDAAHQDCAQACSDCQRECDTCATHCAHQLHAGKGEHMTTLSTCLDCADVCGAASHIVARGGPFSALVCGACADACAKCATECEKFKDDDHMAKCAKECRDCEKACRAMLAKVSKAL
jgi:hypothetical protein